LERDVKLGWPTIELLDRTKYAPIQPTKSTLSTVEAEFHGHYVDFDPIAAWPKPVQKPYPPIYVGGGRQAFDRIAEFGDAWLPNRMSPGKLESMLGELREVAGRDVPVTVYGASSELEEVEAYAQLDVERVLLALPTLPEGETLDHLDSLAGVVAATR